MAEAKNTLSFKPRARIIRTIGDRLISGPETAVIELVKNSHDADANWVRIRFIPPLTAGSGSIIVEDDGHGMTLNDIDRKWMEPATTDKVDSETSRSGKRKLLGSKGIGRFAASKLGKWLDLESTAYLKDGSTSQTTVVSNINWDVFDETEYLSDIEFEYEHPVPALNTGTTLRIRELRDTWTESKLRSLFQELRRMLSPLDIAEDSDFKIYLDLSECTEERCGFSGGAIVNSAFPDREESNHHRVEPFPMLSSCDYEVAGAFDEEGNFDGTMTIHRGRLEPKKIHCSVPIKIEEFGEKPCGIVLVHLFIFDREAEAVKTAMQRAGMGDLKAKQAREILDSISGVAIYRDRFRIRPYGDPDNDWLTLDTLRVQKPGFKIGHNQVSGVLVVDSEQRSGLIEQSNREGLEENGSYLRLKRLISTLFSEVVEPKRYSFRDNAGIGRRNQTDFTRIYESAYMRWAEPMVADLPIDLQIEAREKIARESKRLIGYLKDLEEKQSILEMKVTLGLILGEVLHEGRAPVAFLQDESRRLLRYWPTLCSDSEEALRQRDVTPGILRGMNINADKLRLLFKATEPLAGGRRGKPTQYNPNQIVIDAIQLFRSKLDEAGIDTSHKNDDAIDSVFGYREDLATAITNILDNAIFWLDHHEIRNPLVEFNLSRDQDSCVIEISDNGKGIPEEFRDQIFDVGFSLKPKGTGLGLSIAREAIGRSRGTIEYLDREIGAAFLIRIPVSGF